jgi:hypothetical protein
MKTVLLHNGKRIIRKIMNLIRRNYTLKTYLESAKRRESAKAIGKLATFSFQIFHLQPQATDETSALILMIRRLVAIAHFLPGIIFPRKV